MKVRTATLEKVDVVDLDEVDEEKVPFSPANPMAPPKNIGIAIAGMKSLVRIEVYSGETCAESLNPDSSR